MGGCRRTVGEFCQAADVDEFHEASEGDLHLGFVREHILRVAEHHVEALDVAMHQMVRVEPQQSARDAGDRPGDHFFLQEHARVGIAVAVGRILELAHLPVGELVRRSELRRRGVWTSGRRHALRAREVATADWVGGGEGERRKGARAAGNAQLLCRGRARASP